VELFGSYEGLREGVPEAFHSLVQYMGAQRFRTPRGLEWVRATGKLRKKNEALVFMQRVFLLHGPMWSEGIWEWLAHSLLVGVDHGSCPPSGR
jgi:hypothetical protein